MTGPLQTEVNVLRIDIEAVIRSVAALLMAVGFFYVAYVAGFRFYVSRGVLTRWVATIAVLLWVPTALFHLLALFRLFAPVPALVAIGVLAWATSYLGGRGGRLRHFLAQDAKFVRRAGTLARRSRHWGMICAFLVSAAPGLLRPLILPPMGWDALTYHAVKAGMWIQNGGVDSMFGTGPWGYYQNMLAGGEVFSAWAMLALHSDALAPAVEVGQWFALGFVLIVLARRLSIREPYASIGVCFFLAIPTVKLLVGSGYIELGLLLAFFTGFVLALEGMQHSRSEMVAPALGALGVAAATKLPIVPIAAVVALVVLVRASQRALWVGAIGILAFTVALGPWLVRATSRTGLPFSPLPVKVAGLTLGEAAPELQWYVERPELRPYELKTEWNVVRRLFAPPGTPNEALGFLVVIPLAFSMLGLRYLVTRSIPGVVLVSLVSLLNLAFYWAPDFAVVRHIWTPSSSRFLLQSVALLTLVSLLWCRPKSFAAAQYLWVLRGATLVNLLVNSLTGFSPVSIFGVCVVLAWLMAVGTAGVMLSRTRVRVAAWVVLTVVALLGIEEVRSHLRVNLFAQDFALYPVPQYWVDAVPLVDDPKVPRRVAVTSGPFQSMDNWFASPFLGQAFQNQVVYEPVSADGTLRRFGPKGMNDEFVRTASFQAWVRRLHEHRVTDVMSFTPPSLELEWMEAHPELFERRTGTVAAWGLFKVR